MDAPVIVRSLCPRIAVVSSSDVDALCTANGLGSLAELIRPFEGEIQRVSIRTSQLQTVTASTFPLRFASLDSLEAQPLGRKADRTEEILDAVGAVVGKGAKDWETQCPPIEMEGPDAVDQEYLSTSIEELSPWFTATRDLVLSSRPISEHETFNHPVAVIMAISSSNRDPLNTMAQLYDRVNSSKLFSSRPYMDPTVLRYFVVVHDVGSGPDLDEAQKLLGSIKRTYGPHASLLPINSLLPTLPASPFLHPTYSALPPLDVLEPPASSSSENGTAEEKLLGGRMTDVDVTSLRAFLREMTVQSLLPFMERCVTNWNELFQSSRRGITGRLFGAGRKFFGSSRPASPSPTAGAALGYNIAGAFYPHSTPEATSRRLADFAFMLRDYRFAATVYDSIRKDYASDRALKYQAGANEMFGLAQLMTAPPRTRLDLDTYLEQAVLTYVSRGQSFDPMRATLLYYEGYRALGEYRSAGVALFRAAGEYEEIPSAILIEQAALSDLRLPRPAMRKYAFHMVMAANRYEKCGQKSFSRRCLEQAVVVYRRLSWTSAQIHIEHALGRQAYTMGQSETAVDHFVRLLKGQEGGFLADFELAFEHLQAQHPEKIAALSRELPEPVFLSDRTTIQTCEGSTSRRANASNWAALEERFLETGYEDDVPGRKRPASLSTSQVHSIVSVGETFTVSLVARNPLDCQLVLGNVTIETVEDLPSDTLEIETIPALTLEPGEVRTFHLVVKALAVQMTSFSHVSFNFHNLLPCRQSLSRRGKRLHTTKEQRLTPTYGKDLSLDISVAPPRANLTLSTPPSSPLALGHGEIRIISLELVNSGGAALKGLRLLTSDSSLLSVAPSSLGSPDSPNTPLVPLSTKNDLSAERPTDLQLPDDTLAPRDKLTLSIICHGTSLGAHEALLLFVYHSSDAPEKTLISTISQPIIVHPTLDVRLRHHPSMSSPSQHILDVEIESRASSNIEVSGVVAFGALWTASSTSSEVPSILRPSESISASVDIKAAKDAPSSDMRFTAAKLQRLLSGSAMDLTPPPSTSLYLSTLNANADSRSSSSPLTLPLLLAIKTKRKLAALSQAYPLITQSDARHIFPLFEPRDLDIVVHWKMPAEGRSGALILPTAVIGPHESIFLGLDDEEAGGRVIRSMFEATDVAKKALAASVLGGPLGTESDPVRVEIEADSDVEHDFSYGPYTTDVVFSLTNTSPSVSARVNFTIQEPIPSPLLAASFTGDISHSAILGPLSSASFSSTMWALRPGVYDLAGWTARIETGASSEDAWKARVAFEQGPTEIREMVVRSSNT